MSLIPTVYNSTDPGAPQLTGTIGSLTALLDAVLVDGYGVGADAKAPAGWSREFMAPNVRVYRGNPVTGSGYRLRVDDSAVIGNARHAWAVGYEAMSSADAGVNPVPLKEASVNGSMIPKSITLNTAARRWRVVANELFVYLFVDTSSSGLLFPWFAGDAVSYKPGDLHCFVISDTAVATWTGGVATASNVLRTSGEYTSAVSSANRGLYVGRSDSGAVGSIPASHYSLVRNATYGNMSGGYPSAVNAGLLHMPVMFMTESYRPRGELPGAVGALQVLPMEDGTLLDGVDGFGDDQLLACKYSLRLDTNTAAGATIGTLLLRLGSEWHQ